MKDEKPGYIPGDHWAICDICGEAFRRSQLTVDSDGKYVCALDYDPPHPQETVRVKADKMVPDMTNGPDQQPDYITGFCLSRSAVAGDAIAGCAIAGRDSNDDTVPTGTF